MFNFARTALLGCVVTVSAIGALAGTATAQPASQPRATSTEDQLVRLAQSDVPKRISVDPATGLVRSVQLLNTAMAPQTVTVHNPCQSGDACWQPDAVPYANFGFAGTGTKTGSWTHRRVMYTNNHSTMICWTYQGNSPCSPRAGKNSVLDPLATVTGIKVVNYS